MRIAGVVCLVVLAGSAVAAARPDWTRYVIFPEGAEYAVESRSAESFVIRAKRTDEKVVKTGALAIANVEREMWTHNKFTMTVRSLNGKRVNVGVTLSHPDGSGKTVMTSAPGLEISGRAWRQVVFGLDTDFGLGDRSILIKQAKIGAWVSDWKSGEEGGIEVKDLRLCGPSEVTTSPVWLKGDTFVSIPSAKRRQAEAARPRRADALKVYFAFDNEDVVDSYHRRKNFTDRQQYAGFRETLLEHLDGAAVVVTNVAAAEVIVYSRCAPDAEEAKAIAVAVKERGVPLYAASEVCDGEVEAILPCTIGHEPPEDLPSRARVVAADGAPAFVSDLSTAAFGIYRKIAPKAGAKTLIAFADGTPALVEGVAGKGRVMYSMIGIGASLVPGKESPDAFFVRALGNLSGLNLPERERAVATPSADGWWKGLGSDSFGRFGWEVGSGLLVGQLGSRLAVRNGEAGYEFAVPRANDAPRRVTFAGDRAEPLSLGGEVAVDGEPAFRVDASLAYPGVRWQIRRKEIELRLSNLNGYVALPNGALVDFAAGGEIDVGALTKPWMLLFNGSEGDSPLLLVLQHRPAKVEVLRRGDAVEGLRFVAAGETVGAIVPTWICGSATVDTTGWAAGVPADMRAKAEWWYPYAFSYPIRLREEFRIDERARRIQVMSRYGYARTVDDWETLRAQYAPVPPMAWNLKGVRPAAGGGEIVSAEPAAKPTGLVTPIGDFAVKAGADRVTWSLPLFSPDLSLLPHIAGTAKYEAIADAHFAGGVKFTCGGGVKVDYRKDKGSYAAGRVSANHTLNMHGSTMGLCRCTPNPFIYSEENRRLMRRRMTWRMLEPLETMQFKMVCRWRREPVSGVKYTIYMNSPRDITTRFEPEAYGSKIIYGDSNETVRMILTCLKVLEDRMGQQGVVRANWDAISRHVASYEMAIDDWGIMASGCLEWGGPGSIDMLNSEFGCMMTLARLAEIAGDEAVRAQALYRASRRMCPTLARLRMLDYYAKRGLLGHPERQRASTGFHEGGAVFQPRGRKVQDIDLFDMSQGIPQDLIALYRWYGWNELRRDYLSDTRKAMPGTGLDYITTATLALGDDLADAELQAKLDACAADEKLNRRLPRDWPGMDTGSYIEYTLHRLFKSPVITDCRGVNLHDASWAPQTGRLTLDLTPGEGAALAVDGKKVALGPVGQRAKIVVGK